MTIEEQYQKETGYHEPYKCDMSREYIEWLENKVTYYQSIRAAEVTNNIVIREID